MNHFLIYDPQKETFGGLRNSIIDGLSFDPYEQVEHFYLRKYEMLVQKAYSLLLEYYRNQSSKLTGMPSVITMFWELWLVPVEWDDASQTVTPDFRQAISFVDALLKYHDNYG